MQMRWNVLCIKVEIIHPQRRPLQSQPPSIHCEADWSLQASNNKTSWELAKLKSEKNIFAFKLAFDTAYTHELQWTGKWKVQLVMLVSVIQHCQMARLA